MPSAGSPTTDIIHSTQKSIPILASASGLLEIHEPAQEVVIRNATQLKTDTGLSD
jgi:hypothetical protein